MFRTITVACLLLFVACDKPSSEEGASAASKEGAASETEDKKDKKGKRVKKDRGDASVMLGSKAWEAEQAKAKLNNSTLTIKASRMDMNGSKVSRQQISLVISDYKGPGTYKVRSSGSVFIGVGLDTDSLKEADTDEKQTEEAIKAVKQSSMIPLMKTEATVTSDDGTQIVGTFSQPALADRYPALEAGKFRAIIKK